MNKALYNTLNPNWQIFTISRPGIPPIRVGLYKKKKEISRFVLFFGGRGEFIEKYDYLVEDLGLDDETGFLTWDHRGQGGSGGIRAHIDSYDEYAEDTKRVVEEVVKGAPHIGLAHSMGGLIALYSKTVGAYQPKSLFLNSPLLGLPKSPIPPFIGRPLSQTLCFVGLGRMHLGLGKVEQVPFDKNLLTQSQDKFERIAATPYPIPGVSFGWARATFYAIDKVFSEDFTKSLNIPVELIQCGKEQIVDRESIADWAMKAKNFHPDLIKLHHIQDAMHETFSEREDLYRNALGMVTKWCSSSYLS